MSLVAGPFGNETGTLVTTQPGIYFMITDKIDKKHGSGNIELTL